MRKCVDDASRLYVSGRVGDALYELASARRLIEDAIAGMVVVARDPAEGLPLSWTEIGGSLGMSRQAAQQRYGGA